MLRQARRHAHLKPRLSIHCYRDPPVGVSFIIKSHTLLRTHRRGLFVWLEADRKFVFLPVPTCTQPIFPGFRCLKIEATALARAYYFYCCQTAATGLIFGSFIHAYWNVSQCIALLRKAIRVFAIRNLLNVLNLSTKAVYFPRLLFLGEQFGREQQPRDHWESTPHPFHSSIIFTKSLNR